MQSVSVHIQLFATSTDYFIDVWPYNESLPPNHLANETTFFWGLKNLVEMCLSSEKVRTGKKMQAPD